MRRRNKVVLLPLGVLALLGIADNACGQLRVTEVVDSLVFNFAHPGARSLRLGGAFIAIADDAFAAYRNPAGLTNLSRPELSAEIRNWTYSTRYVDRGHGFGEPTGIGFDTIHGIQEGRADETVTGPAFAAAVFPSKRWSVALYRHELANFRTAFSTSGIFVGDEILSRAYETRKEMELRIASYAVAGSFRVREGTRNRLSVGASISRSTIELASRTANYDHSEFFAPPTHERLLLTDTATGSGADVTVSAGILWRYKLSESDSKFLSVGAVYRRGPTFNVVLNGIGAPGTKFDGLNDKALASFHVPDVVGVGAALENGVSKLSVDVNHIAYSTMVNDFGQPYRLRDGLEVHLGVERIVSLGGLGRRVRLPFVVVGVGAWRDPDHQPAHEDQTSSESLLYPRGKPDDHLAAGLSLPLSESVAVNAAYDHSERQRTLSVSAVVQLARMSRARRPQ